MSSQFVLNYLRQHKFRECGEGGTIACVQFYRLWSQCRFSLAVDRLIPIGTQMQDGNCIFEEQKKAGFR